MWRHVDKAIAELAARQHGFVGRQQLLALGVSTKEIRHRVDVQRLHTLHAGVYSTAPQPLLRTNGRYIAAVLACGEDALLSHRSAAALWGMRPSASARIDVMAPRGARRQPGLTIHTTRSLPAEDVAVSDGIPCTSVARTIVDLASDLRPRDLRAVIERAEQVNLFDGRALDAVLVRSNGRRGIRGLRRLLAELPDEPPPYRYEMERRFLDLVRRSGLPTPVVNARIAGHEVDFHWPAQRLIVETDGRATHGTTVAFERDRGRDLDLHLADWQVIRITWRQLTRQPERVVAALRRRLA